MIPSPNHSPRIDSHQHFWHYDPQQYPWIKPEWPIRQSFLPHDLKPLLEASFDACVAVQARQSLEETRWLCELAAQYSFIAGVVGWVDLRSDNLSRDLHELSHPKLVGVRHVVQDEPDDDFMLRPDFLRGIAQLEEISLAYDILIFPRQLPAAIKLVQKFPEQRFVLDHIAKPQIGDGILEPWRTQIRELARSANVYCKLSGMVTEARWRDWKPADFTPYLETVWEVFGEDRLMIGSDWPVCLLSAAYEQSINLVKNFLAQFPRATQEKVLGTNAAGFYGLNRC
jgi:L-fuconolactonase